MRVYRIADSADVLQVSSSALKNYSSVTLKRLVPSDISYNEYNSKKGQLAEIIKVKDLSTIEIQRPIIQPLTEDRFEKKFEKGGVSSEVEYNGVKYFTPASRCDGLDNYPRIYR